MTGKSRLLQVEMIPDSFWDGRNGHLFLPPYLADAFRDMIATHGLLLAVDAIDQLNQSESPELMSRFHKSQLSALAFSRSAMV